MRSLCRCLTLALSAAAVPAALTLASPQPRSVVLDNVRVIDGTGAAPIEGARVVIEGDRIARIGPAGTVALPADADRLDLSGRTIVPGLIDLHFHIENDPKLALRQLSHGVTAFRDPGQWNEKFEGLRRMIASEQIPGPRIFTTGPHIDGEHPAYPADSVVARDPEEARRLAERNVQQGASALKIYFRLPFASAKAVIDVCQARGIPCTAHLEILDARELIASGLHGLEHITSLGTSVIPQVEAEAYRQAVLANNDARRDGRYELFARADLDGPQAKALYAVLRERKPWIDPTLAVFERHPPSPRGGFAGTSPRPPRGGFGGTGPASPRGGFGGTGAPPGTKPEMIKVMAAGFAKMKELTRRSGLEGARLVMGGHSTVPFAERGEAPWRELELLVESGLSPLEAITAATGTAAGFLYRSDQFGTLRPGLQADLVILRGDVSRDISAIRTVDRVMVGGKWVDVAKYRTY
jgi:imidazolonepropionase-like amidohydrolase